VLDRIKETLLALVPLQAETLLVLLGLVCHLATCLILRRPLSWLWALVPGLVLAVALEAFEIWQHWLAPGLSLRGQVLGILGRHLRDVALVTVPPALVAAAASWLERGAAR
jgi:hypothetical protein